MNGWRKSAIENLAPAIKERGWERREERNF